MKKKCILITFMLINFSTKVMAYENAWGLKVGAAYAYSVVTEVEISHSFPVGFGFASHVGKRFIDWEINMSSYMNFSKLKAMRVEANGSEIQGDGNFQSVTFGPTFRYYYHEYPTKHGTPYLLSGFHTAIQSMKFGVNSVQIDGGNFNNTHKLTFEGYGLLAGIGLDKNRKEKDNYFMEFVYLLNRSHKTSEIGGNNTQVELITTEKGRSHIFENSFFFYVGMTLF